MGFANVPLVIFPQVDPVKLAVRLRRLIEILDTLLPEAEARQLAIRRASTRALQDISNNEIGHAVLTFREALRGDPLWLRGYLSLGLVYREADAPQEAIGVLEAGIDICRIGLGYVKKQYHVLARRWTTDHVVLSRLLHRMAVLRRYEEMLQRQLGLTLLGAGRFEEALTWWPHAGRAGACKPT